MPDYLGMNNLAIIPAPSGFGGYVELGGAPRATGRVFRKHILNLGPLAYKGRTFNLDDAWFTRLKDNFNSGVSMVQVPLADSRNQHSEDPMRNAGEVVGLERDGDKVYSVIDVRDPDVARRIADGRIMGASAFLHMDYTDTRTQKQVGPALLHHCLTNRPYITDLEPYEEVVAATADMEWEGPEAMVLAQPEGSMTREELLAQLKDEHGIDVEALQAQAASRLDGAQLTAQIVEALKGTDTGVQLSGDGSLTSTDIVGAIVELSSTVKALGESNTDLRRKDAEREVQGFIDKGRLLPKSHDRAVEMLLSGDREGLEDFLSPPEAPFIKLNAQSGVTAPDGADKQESDVDSEIMRLTQEHQELLDRGKNRPGSVRK